MIRKSTYTVLIILLILAAVVVFLQRTPGMKSGTTNQATSTQAPRLFNWGDKVVDGILLTDDQGRVFKAGLDNQKNWHVEQPMGCSLESVKVANSVEQLQTINVMVQMEAPPALADVGLTSPTYRLSITFSDGSTQSMMVGSIVPTGSGYYIQVDKNPVVVVTKYSIDSFFELVSTACATATVEFIPTNTLEMTQTVPLTTATTPIP